MLYNKNVGPGILQSRQLLYLILFDIVAIIVGWNRSLLSLKWPVRGISFPFRQYCRSYQCKADLIYQLEMRLSGATKNPGSTVTKVTNFQC